MEIKKKRGRPPKIFTFETTGMTYEGVIKQGFENRKNLFV